MKRTEKSEKIDPSTNSHSGPTILLTGGAGFIGTNFIRHLLAIRPRWRMVNLDALTYAGNAANLDNLAGHTSARYRLLHGDMLEGEIFDVAVDVRRGSPTFGQSAAVTLTDPIASSVVYSAGIRARILRAQSDGPVHVQMQ